MTELELLRWFENPEAPDSYEDEIFVCRWCQEAEGECACIDEWKIID